MDCNTALRGSSGKRERVNAGGYDVSCIIRSLSGSIEGEGGKFSIKRLVSPRDEWLDFDREMQDRIMKETLNEYEISKEKSRRKKTAIESFRYNYQGKQV